MKEKAGFLHKPWFWNGSIAAALIAAIAVFGTMLQLEKNMLTKYERGSIYVAVREISEGQLITTENCWEYFEERKLDKSVIPETAICTPQEVVNLVSCNKIDKGTLLTKAMFESVNEITKDMQEPVIAGFKAEDLYQVVGGVLRSGDRIHIYNVDEEGKAAIVWSNIFVEQVFDSVGVNISNEDTTTAAQRVNVYLDNTEVEKFYSALSTGNLRVVKVCE